MHPSRKVREALNYHGGSQGVLPVSLGNDHSKADGATRVMPAKARKNTRAYGGGAARFQPVESNKNSNRKEHREAVASSMLNSTKVDTLKYGKGMSSSVLLKSNTGKHSEESASYINSETK